MEALSRNWGWLLALGILMIILGVVAMAAPVVATIAIQVMLGWLLVISGIAEGIHAFMVKEWRGFLLELLSAVLYLGVGLMLLVDLLKGALALTLILAVFLLVEGIFKIITALRVREHRGWGWLAGERDRVGGSGRDDLGAVARFRAVGDWSPGRHPAAVHRLVARHARARGARPSSGYGGTLTAHHRGSASRPDCRPHPKKASAGPACVLTQA